jgi:hypothetical protein
MFWNLWKEGLIELIPRINKLFKHKIKVPHYQLSGNGNLRAASGMPEGHKKQTQVIAI